MNNPERKNIYIAAAVVAAVIIFGCLAAFIFRDADAWREFISEHLKIARGTPWALPFVCLIYVVGGLVLFPVTVLNLACAMVFGLAGIFYALAGAMSNAIVFFALGRLLHKKYGEKLLSYPKIKKVDDALNHAGVTGVVGVHLVPVPPYAIVNFAAGLTTIGFYVYMLGTFIVMLPGAVARGIVGDSLNKVLSNPSTETYLYVGGGLILWALFIAGTHVAVKKFQAA